MAVLAPLVVVLSSCGGGEDDEWPSSTPNPNEGRGSLSIEAPTEAPTYTTEGAVLLLSGSAFISPTEFRCCSESASDTGVTVGWSNAAGGGGAAAQSVRYCRPFGFGPLALCGHTWSASIPLVAGTNVITMTAADSSGNVGRDSISVVRIPETTRPLVSSTSPTAGASGVAFNTSVSAHFSEAMRPESMTTATFLLRDDSGNPIGGTVAYANRVATFAPFATLAGATQFTATITTGATDLAGNALASQYVWTFLSSPAPDTTAPTVTSTSPANGSSCAPVDTAIAADFSESISGTQVNSGVLAVVDGGGNPVPGGVSFPTFTRLVFEPASPLITSSSYTATLTNTVRDAAGNPMAANYSWAFTTAGQGDGTWQAISATSVPTARSSHTAVWTGTEMIIWGGASAIGGMEPDRTGGRYHPVSDSWVPTTDVGAPVGRAGHVAVWTGKEMIIWGGRNPLSNSIFTNDGARYDPLTDTWSPISTVGAPLNRVNASAVWTGTEMLVFGGGTGGSNARYNPATDSWGPISAVGAPYGQTWRTAIWTGSKMIVWGQYSAYFCESVGGCNGAYDPVSDTWDAIGLVGAPSGRSYHTAVWTGSEMAIWGGEEPSGLLVNSGGLYNPQTKTWRAMSMSCAASARRFHTAIWNGSEMVIWGPFGQGRATGSRYDPIADAWQHLPISNLPIATWDNHTALWTGTSMIVWLSGYFGAPMGVRYQP